MPRKGYVARMNIEAMLDKYPLIAVRRCFLPLADATEKSATLGTKVLKSEAIGQVVGLSMNLLGGKFEVNKHILYWPTKAELFKDDWNGQTIYVVKNEDFELKNNEGFNLYFKLKDWQGFTFPYHTTAKSLDEFNKMHDDAKKIAEEEGLSIESEICESFKNKNTPFEMKARTKVNHHPNLMNYWHVQLDSYRGNSLNEIVDKDKPCSERKKIATLLKNELKVKYMANYTLDYHINKADYQCLKGQFFGWLWNSIAKLKI